MLKGHISVDRPPLFIRSLTVDSFEGRYLMELNPHKEIEHLSKPHDGIDKGDEMNMSNCKTKKEAKKEVLDLAFLLHDENSIISQTCRRVQHGQETN